MHCAIVQSDTAMQERASSCAGEDAPLLFSLNYAAPEVLAAARCDASHIVAQAATDVWALGIIAFGAAPPMSTPACVHCHEVVVTIRHLCLRLWP